MEVQKQTQLSFRGVDIVNVNLQIENHVVANENEPVSIKITPKVFFPKDTVNEFVIIIEASLIRKGSFSLSLLAFGAFNMPGFSGNVREQKPFININAPAIMFPYVRSFVSTFTANLGQSFRPVLIPPHFFQGDLVEHMEKEEIIKPE